MRWSSGMSGVALGHAALDRDGALHGVDHARELHQRAVAHQLDDAPVMRGDGGLDEVSAGALSDGREYPPRRPP